MIDRKKIKTCPICGSQKITHVYGDHVSKHYGTTPNVPQTICQNCGEIFLGPDSLDVIRSTKLNMKRKINTMTP
jgi:YgiT-type zinc finger domain-containing protein